MCFRIHFAAKVYGDEKYVIITKFQKIGSYSSYK